MRSRRSASVSFGDHSCHGYIGIDVFLPEGWEKVEIQGFAPCPIFISIAAAAFEIVGMNPISSGKMYSDRIDKESLCNPPSPVFQYVPIAMARDFCTLRLTLV